MMNLYAKDHLPEQESTEIDHFGAMVVDVPVGGTVSFRLLGTLDVS